jgi:hypothetical protein
MTPAEQYRTLIDRLQLLEDNADQWTYTNDQPVPQQPPQREPVEIPPDQNRYPPKALGVFPTTQFREQFQSHCLGIIKNLSRYVDPTEKQILDIIRVKVTTDPRDQVYALARTGDIVIDYEELGDAPDNVLTFLLAHEVGHIVMGHRGKVTPQVSQQQEIDADDYAIRLCTAMGITKAPVFTWLHRKKDELGRTEFEDYLDWDLNPANAAEIEKSTHPSYPVRFDNAAKKGLKLSKANTDQIDRLLAHMSRTV